LKAFLAYGNVNEQHCCFAPHIAALGVVSVKTLLVPAALLAIATAAVAQPSAGSDTSTADNKTTAGRTNEKGERLICRWVQDSDVGSLVSGRTRRCLTAEQWRAMPRR
jgi:hypothetical protein